jgi:hypothetical protein
MIIFTIILTLILLYILLIPASIILIQLAFKRYKVNFKKFDILIKIALSILLGPVLMTVLFSAVVVGGLAGYAFIFSTPDYKITDSISHECSIGGKMVSHLYWYRGGEDYRFFWHYEINNKKVLIPPFDNDTYGSYSKDQFMKRNKEYNFEGFLNNSDVINVQENIMLKNEYVRENVSRVDDRKANTSLVVNSEYVTQEEFNNMIGCLNQIDNNDLNISGEIKDDKFDVRKRFSRNLGNVYYGKINYFTKEELGNSFEPDSYISEFNCMDSRFNIFQEFNGNLTIRFKENNDRFLNRTRREELVFADVEVNNEYQQISIDSSEILFKYRSLSKPNEINIFRANLSGRSDVDFETAYQESVIFEKIFNQDGSPRTDFVYDCEDQDGQTLLEYINSFEKDSFKFKTVEPTESQ